MSLLKKKINWIEVNRHEDIYDFPNGECNCPECVIDRELDEDIIDDCLAMDTIEIVAQEVKNQWESIDELLTWLKYLWDATLETDQLLAEWFHKLTTQVKLLTEYLGVEFEVIPEVPAIPAKTIIKKKSTNKKK